MVDVRASGEIDSKPSSRACSRGHGFIALTAFLAIKLKLKPHLHEQKDWHGTPKFWHRAQANWARHSSFTRATMEDFLTNGPVSYSVLAPLILTNFARK